MNRSRSKAVFVCRQCGGESPKWQGRCPVCREWNTLEEVALEASPRLSRGGASLSRPEELSQVKPYDSPRLPLPLGEVNRVLGGGLVPGSVVLLAGDPGIGKSTLLLQLAAGIASQKERVLYVTGEESVQQVKMRAERLGVFTQGLFLLAEVDVEAALAQVEALRPALVLVDSIQAMYHPEVSSGPGSVAQVREAALALIQWGKAKGTPLLLSGHVTKDGSVAGPRVLEHMVDVVLYLEGDPLSSYRILRGVKNRFGSTNEVGILEMGGLGLKEVTDPALLFLSERREGTPGSVVVVTMEGTRPLLVELQALANANLYAPPRRTANGVDFNRMLMVLAVLARRLGLPLGQQDVLINVAGGLKIQEPAADLGMALAVVSSFKGVPVRGSMVAIGELGLGGEVRRSSQMEGRLQEADQRGFRLAMVPASSKEELEGKYNVELLGVETVGQAVAFGLEEKAAQQVGVARRAP